MEGSKIPHKRVGLALSGAVARGAAHIGVLQVLEREHIPIDVVTGTSAGALVGALYCAGFKPEQMKALIGRLGWTQVAGLACSRQGFIRFNKLERYLIRCIGDLKFGELKRPFAAVTTDLARGKPVVLREGRVARAVHASCAVPGFVVPVNIDGQLLCDGGVTANLPARAARELGAEIVVGVDLFVHHVRKQWGPPGYGLAAFETLVRGSGDGLESADCLITPDVAGHSYLCFGAYQELIAKGAAAAERKVDEIRRLLAETGA